MRKCLKCDRENIEGSNFCAWCGSEIINETPVAEKISFCQLCGKSIKDKKRFCGNCGNQLLGKDSRKISSNLNQSIDKTKLEKEINKLGRFSKAIGWVLCIFLGVLIFVWGILDPNFSDAGLPKGGIFGLIINILVGIVFIKLGKKISEFKNIIRNIWILIGLCLTIFFVSPTVVQLLVLIYLIIGLIKAYKLKK